jgi:hypothetical protein
MRHPVLLELFVRHFESPGWLATLGAARELALKLQEADLRRILIANPVLQERVVGDDEDEVADRFADHSNAKGVFPRRLVRFEA